MFSNPIRIALITLAIMVTLGTQVGLILSKKLGPEKDKLMNAVSYQLQNEPLHRYQTVLTKSV